MSHLGDYVPGVTIYSYFTTIDADGAPTTLSGSPTATCYKDGGNTEDTSGITLTADEDGVTGLNVIAIDTSADGTFFAAGSTFVIVLTAGTVDTTSVVGYVVDTFTLGRASAYARLGAPAGASVSADIAAVKAQTAAIEVDTAEIGAAGAGLTNINLPNQTMDIVGNITGNLSGSVGSVTGAVGSVTGAVGSVTGAVGSVTGLTASDVGAIKLKTDNLPSDPADASVVAGLIAAVEAKVDTVDTVVDAVKAKTDNLPTDPADASVIAGRFDTLDTSVADLPTNSELTTALAGADDAVLAAVATVDTVVDAIKVQTDKLTFTVANQLDANVQSINDVTITGDGQTGTEFGV